MSPIRILQVDAFADRPFGGNPAAVCFLEAEASGTWMQSVAAEMNLSETAFVVPLSEARYQLRWFTPHVLRSLKPDFRELGDVPTRGLIVTSRSENPKFDFVSRFFAPAAGIDEDPVTGSAHCCLGPYWSAELGNKEMVGYQASRRGGIVHVRVAGDRVMLAGHAVTVMRGDFVHSD